MCAEKAKNELPACPVETTLTLIGDKWKVLILRDLMPGTKRFGELKKSVGNVSHVLKNKELLITVETKDDIILEKGLLANKSDSFEAIFGIKPVLREKRKL